jgi:hypothetical protein
MTMSWPTPPVTAHIWRERPLQWRALVSDREHLAEWRRATRSALVDAVERGHRGTVTFVHVDDDPRRVAPAATDAHEHASGTAGSAHTPTAATLLDADGEVRVELSDGWSLRSGVYDPDNPDALTSGEYVRLCRADGSEYAYWDQDEWASDPALVMGAIVNAAAGLRFTDTSTP